MTSNMVALLAVLVVGLAAAAAAREVPAGSDASIQHGVPSGQNPDSNRHPPPINMEGGVSIQHGVPSGQNPDSNRHPPPIKMKNGDVSIQHEVPSGQNPVSNIHPSPMKMQNDVSVQHEVPSGQNPVSNIHPPPLEMQNDVSIQHGSRAGRTRIRTVILRPSVQISSRPGVVPFKTQLDSSTHSALSECRAAVSPSPEMARGTTSMEVRADGVAVITISNPPVNALSLDVLASLQKNYVEALNRNDVKAIVLTGAKGRFCGGFDINAFGNKPKNAKPGSLSIDFLTDIVEDARKPSVAAIDGIALGGGLEVAMVCHARVSTPSAQLGLPELQLGIIPGMGGTQRLPRLVGLPKALEMMLMSKPIKGKDAHDLGLVDAIASAHELVSAACSLALEIVEQKRPWFKSLYRTDKLPTLGEAKEILRIARVQAQKQAASVQHPTVCIDVIEEGIVSDPRVGLMKEVLSGKMLEESSTSKSLRHVFFAQRATSKSFVKKGQLTKLEYEKKLSLLSGVLDYEQFRDADVVIEAAVFLVDYGLDVYHIDHVITQFGMPMGPFRLADLVGFGVALPQEINIFKVILSVATIRCFFRFFWRIIGQLMKLSDNDIVEMIFLPVVNEACRVLDEGIAVKASDLDVASIMGMGFPSYRGGVMFWADSLGAKYVYTRLEEWSKDYGGFFKPCEYLAARTRQNASLAAVVDGAQSRL
ncbi:hypothetical protein PR202_gb00949 [Eleusine coracana subsp. coracana]|uniref:3-hydroxyacyl-CoA dehydrogenase C-terminal domain-containing protein n=1 Tax=Eleusine coracana subsp. coracana TaxID=191504 RepID=A0AAV5DV04_ELECO|nr:hypothetical protein PR202_gb00949 [Eleusine coracana subsp. coracana]